MDDFDVEDLSPEELAATRAVLMASLNERWGMSEYEFGHEMGRRVRKLGFPPDPSRHPGASVQGYMDGYNETDRLDGD